MLKNRFFLFCYIILSFSGISCSVFYNPYKSDVGVLVLDSTQINHEDSVVLSMIAPYKAALDGEMNEVISYAERHLHKAQPEGLLNNLVSDIVFIESNRHLEEKGKNFRVDFAILNNGGLRAPLPSGAITIRNIYELMPFDNEIVILQLSGEKTKTLLNYVAENKGVPISGVKMGIKDNIATNVLINGKAFDIKNSYYVATSDYLASGGDKMAFFSAPILREETNYLVRDAIIHFMKKELNNNRVINSELDGRIYFE